MSLMLVTGPVRSGKSRFVVARAQASPKAIRYVATAMRDPNDDEWSARIKRHEDDRPGDWDVIESAGLAHATFLDVFHDASGDECIVIDALGTWLAARMAEHAETLGDDYARFEALLDGEATELADAMVSSKADVIVVAEEVGWDVVPVSPSARLFRDVLGRMKQRLAVRASDAFLVVCGYALDLRKLGVTV